MWYVLKMVVIQEPHLLHLCLTPQLCPYAPALATALDIGLSNWSFLFITISL